MHYSGNCGTCQIPITYDIYPLCNPCIRYLNRLSDEEFAEVAITSFGKTGQEADEWLSRVQHKEENV